jgi:hypothetical protein
VSTVFECAGATSTVDLVPSAAPRGSLVMLLNLSTSHASFVPLRLVRQGIRIEPSLIYDHPDDRVLARHAEAPTCSYFSDISDWRLTAELCYPAGVNQVRRSTESLAHPVPFWEGADRGLTLLLPIWNGLTCC